MLYKNEKRKTKKVVCNTNRICEVEDAVVEWLNVSKINQPKLHISTEQYLSHFNVLSVQYNELDLHFNRIVLQAKRKGTFENA